MRRPRLPESFPELIWTLALALPAITGGLFVFYLLGSEGPAGRTYPAIYPLIWLVGVALALSSLMVRRRRTVLASATIVLVASQVYGVIWGG